MKNILNARYIINSLSFRMATCEQSCVGETFNILRYKKIDVSLKPEIVKHRDIASELIIANKIMAANVLKQLIKDGKHEDEKDSKANDYNIRSAAFLANIMITRYPPGTFIVPIYNNNCYHLALFNNIDTIMTTCCYGNKLLIRNMHNKKILVTDFGNTFPIIGSIELRPVKFTNLALRDYLFAKAIVKINSGHRRVMVVGNASCFTADIGYRKILMVV